MLADVIERLRGAIPGARWVPRQNLHATLSFLGSVDAERIPDIARAVGRAVADLADMPAALEGLGAFPNEAHARVVWAGISDLSGGVEVLAGEVFAAMEALGFPRDDRPFRAHVTLARLRDPALVHLDVAIEPMRFIVDRVTLFESHIGRVPQYEPLASFPFRRAPTAPRSE